MFDKLSYFNPFILLSIRYKTFLSSTQNQQFEDYCYFAIKQSAMFSRVFIDACISIDACV